MSTVFIYSKYRVYLSLMLNRVYLYSIYLSGGEGCLMNRTSNNPEEFKEV